MGTRKNLKEKILFFQDLKEKNLMLFVKKVLSIEKKSGYSDLQKNIRNKRVKQLNILLSTKIFLKWDRIGESDSYELVEIQGIPKERKSNEPKIIQLELFC